MGRLRPKKVLKSNKSFKRARHFSKRLKDEDQIYDEYQNPIPQPINIDLPGLGQFYCLSCARHFSSKETLLEHNKTSLHRRLLRKLKTEKPYTVEEANAAAGFGSYTYTPKGHKQGEEIPVIEDKVAPTAEDGDDDE